MVTSISSAHSSRRSRLNRLRTDAARACGRRHRPARRNADPPAPSFGVELQPIDVSDAGEIERELADFAHAPNGSLIVPLSVFERPPSAPTAGDLS